MYTINELFASPYTYTQGRESIQYIVVPYPATQASAYNNCVYFSGGNRNASAHYFIDDDSIWRSVGDWDTAWHAGNWWMNQNSIGIEVVSDGRDFSQGEIDRLAWLVADLMERYGVPSPNVIRHYDVADYAGWDSTLDPHKLCPAPYVDYNKWLALKETITGGFDMTPYQAAQLDFVYNHMRWNEQTHFSDLGNLVTQMPIDYPSIGDDGEEIGHTAPLGARLGYIDQRMHVIEANQAEIIEKLDSLLGTYSVD